MTAQDKELKEFKEFKELKEFKEFKDGGAYRGSYGSRVRRSLIDSLISHACPP